MATVPRDLRLAPLDRNRSEWEPGGELYALRSSSTVSPSGMRRTPNEFQRMKSFTTDDLPHESQSLLPPQKGVTDLLRPSKVALKKGLNSINTESVVKLSAVIVNKVKRSFTQDESERLLREDWIILETEDEQLQQLKEVVTRLDNAFQFSKSSALVSLANSTLLRCEALIEQSQSHTEQCQLMFSQCSNEMVTLQDYLSKLREAIQPVVGSRDKKEEKRLTRRAEWAVSRMLQTIQSMVSEMRENMEEIDALITECTKLMVQTITLLHMRTRSADFSGTGVAAGAASVVAGAMVRRMVVLCMFTDAWY